LGGFGAFMIKLRKTILTLLLGVFSMWVIAFAWIHLSYSSNLPGVPDEKTGRIYRMVVNHGFIRYGSERELHILKTIEDFQPIAILLFLLAVVLGLIWGVFKIAGSRKL
jgi:hypothetical protein